MYIDQLSYDADRLLSSVDRNPQRPHYRDDTFRRKLTKARQYEAKLPPGFHSRRPTYLVEKEWKAILDRANLTGNQLHVVSLRLEGHTFESIGRRRGHSKQGAQNIFYQAAKKLVEAWTSYPFRGLADVYEDETRRGVRNRDRRPMKKCRSNGTGLANSR